MAKNETNWESIAVRLVKESRQVTKFIDGSNERELFEDAANYEQWRVSLAVDLDKGKTYPIVGVPSSIIEQVSSAQLTHDTLGRRLGFTIAFDKWFNDFSHEFLGTYSKNGSYKIDSKIKVWGNNIENRPDYKFTNDDDIVFENYNYHKIKFWVNRLQKDKFIILTGTLNELRQQMIDLMRSGKTQSISTGKENYFPFVSNKGKPRVQFFFYQKLTEVTGNYRLEARPCFRINKHEKRSVEELESLSLLDVEQLAQRIQSTFNTPNPYKFKKGKETCSYRDKRNGIETYSYFSNASDARELYQKLCSVAQVPYNASKFYHTQNDDPANAYPETVPNENIFGEQVEGKKLRPIGDVYFTGAVLSLASFSKPIILVDAEGIQFKASTFDIESYIMKA